MVKRYNDDGFEGLQDRPRSGRRPDVPEEIMTKIRQELVEIAIPVGISDGYGPDI